MPHSLEAWIKLDAERRARAKKRGAKAYRFLLASSQTWQTYIGAARNVKLAAAAIAELLGEKPVTVRIHPLCDPWPRPMPRTASASRPDRAA